MCAMSLSHLFSFRRRSQHQIDNGFFKAIFSCGCSHVTHFVLVQQHKCRTSARCSKSRSA